MNINHHKGHRQRVKEKFMKFGLDCFSEHEIMELLLFYAIPQKDTNELAHKLIYEFKNIARVFDATPEKLKDFGLSDNAISFIKLLPATCAKYVQERSEINEFSLSYDDIITELSKHFIDKNDENIAVLLADSGGRLITSEIVSKGTLKSASFDIKKLIEIAIKNRAASVVIAHNHPSDYVIPSTADLKVTSKIKTALESININFIDHLVYSRSEVFSIEKEKIYEYNLTI